jgi:hypothetical protein
MTAVAVTPSLPMTQYCGGRTRAGGTCRRESGWGTDHVGFGRCKLHGGCTIAENTGERLASALEEALEGVELSGDQRRVIVQRFAGSLARLEREQPAIPAKASDA